MSDPLVLIGDKAGREYQVLKSAFHRLYEDAGYEITAIVGGHNDAAPDVPALSETTTANVAPERPNVDAIDPTEPVADASVASNPAELAPLEPSDAPPVADAPAPDGAAA